MAKYILRRLVMLVPVLIGVSIVVFGIVHLVPGDPVIVILGNEYDEEIAQQITQILGLDRPLYVQYFSWLSRVVQGDLGRSIYPFKLVKDTTQGWGGDPVLGLILSRLPTTILLTIGTVGIGTAIAIPLGVISAVKKDSAIDSIIRIVSVLGVCMPVFWIGLLLILLFSLKLRWLPPGGSITEYGLKVMILPWIALSMSFAALVTRLTRSSMLEVLSMSYITTARAKGLKDILVYSKHALPNALIPVVTVIGLSIARMLGGAVLTESVFNLNGMGRLLVESVYRRDYPVLQGCVLFIALILVFSNLVVDVLYAVLDPRVSMT